MAYVRDDFDDAPCVLYIAVVPFFIPGVTGFDHLGLVCVSLGDAL